VALLAQSAAKPLSTLFIVLLQAYRRVSRYAVVL